MDIAKLQRSLDKSEIDFRVGQVYKYGNDVYMSLLAYKDARVDMKILDEACGQLGWQVTYERDSKGYLKCAIGIFSELINQWIWKESNGIESNTEKIKGEYSDAFKRAGFMWGIGRKLYDFPRIVIKLNEGEWEMENVQGREKPKVKPFVKPNEWNWTFNSDYTSVQAKDSKGNVRYSSGQISTQAANTTTTPPAETTKTPFDPGKATLWIAACATIKDLTKLWNDYPEMAKIEALKKLFTERKEALQNGK